MTVIEHVDSTAVYLTRVETLAGLTSIGIRLETEHTAGCVGAAESLTWHSSRCRRRNCNCNIFPNHRLQLIVNHFTTGLFDQVKEFTEL